MRDGKRESGRLMFFVLVALALSAGVITWKRASEAPEKAFRTGMDEYARRAFPRAAIAWKEADRLGHLEATQRLAALYLEGEGVELDQRRAFELYEKAARAGLGEAQLRLAGLYETGRGTDVDMEQAVAWYWSAAKNEVPEAQYILATLYDEGRGVGPDLDEAAGWYRLAAQAGRGEAQLALGLMYHQGRGVAKSPEEAAHWLRRAAEDSEIPEAVYLIGTYHESGLGGLPRNIEQAIWCFERAGVRHRHPDALYRFAMYALKGAASKYSHDPIHLLELAAERGHVGAMYELGRAYDPGKSKSKSKSQGRGKGPSRSQPRAEQWYGRAAAQGHVEAMAAGQELGAGQEKLSRSERRRLEKKRAEDRARRESEHSRKMMQVGRCEVYGSGGPRSEMRVEMRTRMDCLNRGGSFETADLDDRGSFSTMDDGRSWDSRRRELNRLRTAERRRSRASGFTSGDVEPLETDWVVCYARGSRRSNGRAGNSCSSAMRKTRDRTTSWCRDRGYDSRRLFKHESSARSWASENCR